MELDGKTIIMQNPDGSIQVATQPHYKGKKQLQCYKCRCRLIYEGNAIKIKCTNCQSLNGVPSLQQEQQQRYISCASCGGKCQLILVDNMLIGTCNSCGWNIMLKSLLLLLLFFLFSFKEKTLIILE